MPLVSRTAEIPIAMIKAMPRSWRSRSRIRRMPPLSTGSRARPESRPSNGVLRARAVAEHDVVLELVQLRRLGRLHVHREVDADGREHARPAGGRAVAEDVGPDEVVGPLDAPAARRATDPVEAPARAASLRAPSDRARALASGGENDRDRARRVEGHRGRAVHLAAELV